MQSNWSLADIPDQTGVTAVVTGSTSGIGYEAARVLAERGATVLLACRNLEKARQVAAHMKGRVEVVELDLGSLRSVDRAAHEIMERCPRLELLINNAGVMVPPYGLTRDGFELQFGTNHLGHFALTGRLYERLVATPKSRIVNVASLAHNWGRIQFDDLQWSKRYSRGRAYAQSKLANLLFTYHLQRRLLSAGSTTLSLAAHPGWSRTELQRHTRGNPIVDWIHWLLAKLFSQDQLMGALPTLRAALDPAAAPYDYYGPAGFMQLKGPPVRVTSNATSYDRELQRKLWEISEHLTGVHYP